MKALTPSRIRLKLETKNKCAKNEHTYFRSPTFLGAPAKIRKTLKLRYVKHKNPDVFALYIEF
jgi:hypothetical protein